MSLEKNKMGGVDEKKEDKEGVGGNERPLLATFFSCKGGSLAFLS